MFNPNERIIGAAYVMQECLLENILSEIEIIVPRDDNITNEEFASSIVHKSDNFLTENDKRERIIGAATVMCKKDAYKIWEKILYLISIPEVTPEEDAVLLDKELNESQMYESEQ